MPYEQQNNRPIQVQQPTYPPTNYHTYAPTYPTTTAYQPTTLRNRFGSFECGMPDYKAPIAQGLVYGGTEAHRGQFPW